MERIELFQGDDEKVCFQFSSEGVDGSWRTYITWKVVPDEQSSSAESSGAHSSSDTSNFINIIMHIYKSLSLCIDLSQQKYTY